MADNHQTELVKKLSEGGISLMEHILWLKPGQNWRDLYQERMILNVRLYLCWIDISVSG